MNLKTVRPIALADLEALLVLEQKCWDEHLQGSREDILERINYNPSLQFVLEIDGIVRGVLYTQQIAESKNLESGKFSDLKAYRDSNGHVLQLVAISVEPNFHENIGAYLRNFVYNYAKESVIFDGVVAMTRYIPTCKIFIL